MSSPAFSALLVRIPAGKAASLRESPDKLSLAGGVRFELEPLFRVPAGAPGELGLTQPGGWEWHLARLVDRIDGAHPWELAHASVRQQLSMAEANDLYIEPDLVQVWECQTLPATAEQLTAAAAENACTFHDQMSSLPSVAGHFALGSFQIHAGGVQCWCWTVLSAALAANKSLRGSSRWGYFSRRLRADFMRSLNAGEYSGCQSRKVSSAIR